MVLNPNALCVETYLLTNTLVSVFICLNWIMLIASHWVNNMLFLGVWSDANDYRDFLFPLASIMHLSAFFLIKCVCCVCSYANSLWLVSLNVNWSVNNFFNLSGQSFNCRILWEHTRGRYSCLQCGHCTPDRGEMTAHIECQHKNHGGKVHNDPGIALIHTPLNDLVCLWAGWNKLVLVSLGPKLLCYSLSLVVLDMLRFILLFANDWIFCAFLQIRRVLLLPYWLRLHYTLRIQHIRSSNMK